MYLVSVLIVPVRLAIHLLHEVAQEPNDLVLCLVETLLDVLADLLEVLCAYISWLALKFIWYE